MNTDTPAYAIPAPVRTELDELSDALSTEGL